MPNLNNADDNELLRLMLTGHEEAFTTLYRRHSSIVYRFAYRMCSGLSTVAEDVTQDVFLILMKDGNRYDQTRATLTTYLLGITRNQVLRRLSGYKPLVPFVDEPDLDQAGASDPLLDITRAETIESLRQAVMALPAHYREAVILCDLEEMSYADAAIVLDCAVGTVRSRLHRGRGMLVEKFRAISEPGEPTAAEKPLRSLL